MSVPVGLVLCSLVQFAGAFVFVLTGILFLVAPASLRDAGFGQDVALGARVAGMLAFVSVGTALAWNAWRLIHLIPFALEVTRGFALATAGLFVAEIVDDGAGSVPNWLGVVAAVAVAGYLTRPTIRGLFRSPN